MPPPLPLPLPFPLQVPCIGREMLYAAGYLGLFPIIRAELEARGVSPGSATIIGGVTGGVFAAFCSHPFDTIKTRMQVCTWLWGLGLGGWGLAQSRQACTPSVAGWGY